MQIELTAVWFPANLGPDAQKLLAVIKKHGVKPQLWVTTGEPAGKDQSAKVEAAAKVIARSRKRPPRSWGARWRCTTTAGGSASPRTRSRSSNTSKLKNVGIVYNLHHGHEDFAGFLALMQPYSLCPLNLNGMNDGAKPKILPIGLGKHEQAT